MPFVTLNTPTELLLQWGWFLVTRANALMYILIVVVFLLGMFVRLPRARKDVTAVEASWDEASDAEKRDGDA